MAMNHTTPPAAPSGRWVKVAIAIAVLLAIAVIAYLLLYHGGGGGGYWFVPIGAGPLARKIFRP
ncbi:MAG TPA: hypothetical protein VE976_01730 [Actinomycetota bacterium]|nr:hypothetical protein [Actinomycetota bacterium]